MSYWHREVRLDGTALSDLDSYNTVPEGKSQTALSTLQRIKHKVQHRHCPLHCLATHKTLSLSVLTWYRAFLNGIKLGLELVTLH